MIAFRRRGEVWSPGNAPEVMIRHRPRPLIYRHGRTIAPWWQSKQTGNRVEVVRYYQVVDQDEMRVIFIDWTMAEARARELNAKTPDMFKPPEEVVKPEHVAQELSLEEGEFRARHEMMGHLLYS